MSAPEGKRLKHRTDYRRHRAGAYPPITEALDAIAKGFRAMANGEPLPKATMAWVDECEAVKGRFPKA